MNKKILIVSILAIFMLLAISFATAVNNKKNEQNKESPLFAIRTNRAINIEKMNEIREKIITRFSRQRIFFLPFQQLTEKEKNNDNRLATQKDTPTQCYTCYSDTARCGVTCIGGTPTMCQPTCKFFITCTDHCITCWDNTCVNDQQIRNSIPCKETNYCTYFPTWEVCCGN